MENGAVDQKHAQHDEGVGKGGECVVAPPTEAPAHKVRQRWERSEPAKLATSELGQIPVLEFVKRAIVALREASFTSSISGFRFA